jgi:hypothetical protein
MCYLKGDFTIIRAHQHAAGAKKRGEDQALGPSRGGLSTKIHMAVRGPGCRVRFTPTAGQKGDAPQGDALIEGLPAEVVMAYTALSSAQRHRRQARDGGDSQQPVPCANVPLHKHFYAQRHLVEAADVRMLFAGAKRRKWLRLIRCSTLKDIVPSTLV